METSNKFNISEIIESLINGQYTQAKEQLQKGCKTKPEKQARKLAQVVGKLMDSEDDSFYPDIAARFINRFDCD